MTSTLVTSASKEAKGQQKVILDWNPCIHYSVSFQKVKANI